MSDEELRRLQQDIQQLKDIEDIKRLKARYFECVDTQAWSRWADEVLAEDFHFDSEAGVLKAGTPSWPISPRRWRAARPFTTATCRTSGSPGRTPPPESGR